MGIQIGSTDIADIGKIKYGNTDIQEVFVGSNKVWPATIHPVGPPEIEVQLIPGETTFGFKTNSPFTVEQDGATVAHPAAPRGVTITGMNDGSFIKIKVTNDASDTTFGFNKVDSIVHVKLNSVGKMTSLSETFFFLRSITTFECAADLSGVTDFSWAWVNCEKLTSFPAIDTSSGTNFGSAWVGCEKLTSFPAIDTSSGTNFDDTWGRCLRLTSFPAIDTSSGTNFERAWWKCSGLTSFPAIDTSSGTNFGYAWVSCSRLTSFPAIDTSSGTDFGGTWQDCPGLTSFPAIDTSSGTDLYSTWADCTGLTSLPAIDTSSGTRFRSTWRGCTNLVCIAGTLDFRKLTDGDRTFEGCDALTSPAFKGTPVRSRASALAGIWTNPGTCP